MSRSLTLRWRAAHPDDRGFVLALVAGLPLLVWWLGFFPGFLSSDSMDQWGQIVRFEISNHHPAFHTWLMWLITRAWTSPGAVTLAQVVAMTVVLAVAARRLVQFGAGPRAAAAWVVGIALLPAVSITTLALWKDVAFTIAMLWVFTELLGYAARPEQWGRVAPAVRIGAALSLCWLFRHNGFITVVIIGAVLVWRLRRERNALLALVGVVAGVVGSVTLILYPLITEDRSSIDPAMVFVPDVAASFNEEPHNFSASEVEYLAAIAPLEVWRDAYDCHDSTPLVFSPEFDDDVVLADPGRFRRLVVATYLRDLDTVLGHRWCASSYLVVPWQMGDRYFHRPPYEIPPNEFGGVERRPISDRAFAVTDRVFRWAGEPGHLWLAWRPGLAVWAAAIAMVVAMRRGRARALGLPVALIAIHMANVALTSPDAEFRFAFPIYLMCLVVGGVVLLGRSTPAPDGSGSRDTAGYRPEP